MYKVFDKCLLAFLEKYALLIVLAVREYTTTSVMTFAVEMSIYSLCA